MASSSTLSTRRWPLAAVSGRQQLLVGDLERVVAHGDGRSFSAVHASNRRRASSCLDAALRGRVAGRRPPSDRAHLLLGLRWLAPRPVGLEERAGEQVRLEHAAGEQRPGDQHEPVVALTDRQRVVRVRAASASPCRCRGRGGRPPAGFGAAAAGSTDATGIPGRRHRYVDAARVHAEPGAITYAPRERTSTPGQRVWPVRVRPRYQTCAPRRAGERVRVLLASASGACPGPADRRSRPVVELGEHLGRVRAGLGVDVDDGDAARLARDADVRARPPVPPRARWCRSSRVAALNPVAGERRLPPLMAGEDADNRRAARSSASSHRSLERDRLVIVLASSRPRVLGLSSTTSASVTSASAGGRCCPYANSSESSGPRSDSAGELEVAAPLPPLLGIADGELRRGRHLTAGWSRSTVSVYRSAGV